MIQDVVLMGDLSGACLSWESASAQGCLWVEEEAGARAVEGAAGSGERRDRARCAPCMGWCLTGCFWLGGARRCVCWAGCGGLMMDPAGVGSTGQERSASV